MLKGDRKFAESRPSLPARSVSPLEMESNQVKAIGMRDLRFHADEDAIEMDILSDNLDNS